MLDHTTYWRRGTSFFVGGATHYTNDHLPLHIHPREHRTYGCANCTDGVACSNCRNLFPTQELAPFEEVLESGLCIIHVVFATDEHPLDDEFINALVELNDPLRLAHLAARMRDGTAHPLVLAAAA